LERLVKRQRKECGGDMVQMDREVLDVHRGQPAELIAKPVRAFITIMTLFVAQLES
jgi:hypothetical protein